jgi:hypothetical protein
MREIPTWMTPERAAANADKRQGNSLANYIIRGK